MTITSVFFRTASILGGLLMSVVLIPAVQADTVNKSSHVEVRKTDNGWAMFCNNSPFFIQGAGGDGSQELLKKCGGNSVRLWGADNIDGVLDEAQKLGLKVTVGIWFEHLGGARNFTYQNPEMAAEQVEKVRVAVEKYKNHPAVLMWGIGNEMEGEDGSDPAIWGAVQAAAKLAHQLDPNHPTMTVIAELGGKRIESISKYCPDIDIVGINSYAGGVSVAKRYRELGGTKPFVITEYGPAGQWEVGKTLWKAPIEPTSTAKAESYRATYTESVLTEKGKLCLGSYAFLWGNKQEATATWFGMLLPDGTRVAAVDTMQELWSGTKATYSCPQIEPIKLDHEQVAPGSTVHATLKTVGEKLTVQWKLTRDTANYITMGAFQKDAHEYPEAITNADLNGCDVKLPEEKGPYWLYAIVKDEHNGAATSVVSINVRVPSSAKAAGVGEKFPFILYGDSESAPPFAWSGWMGETSSMSVDDKYAKDPHTGKTSMKCEFKSTKGFGAIAWQSPVNDWGDRPGGYNLTSAKKLSFWAKGDAGGEVVSFKLGILGSDKKYPDSDSAELADVKLTKEWKQYSVDLEGKDLSCIKTGFVWAVGNQGKPVIFYLDDIQYE